MYRLIWFQHVHKAAGSAIINQAIANGEILYPVHENGNPCSSSQQLLPIWDYEDNELLEFIDDCQSQGVTFVATEWGSPTFRILNADPRVVLVTCIREPWSRLVSNYNYDYYLGFSRSPSLSEFMIGEHRIKLDNYLVRVFSGDSDHESDALGLESVNSSINNLQLFDLVLITEREGDLKTHLFEALGWKAKAVDNHSTFGNLWTFSKLIRQLRLLSAVSYLLSMKRQVTEGDRISFEEKSSLELELYRRVNDLQIRGRIHPLHFQ
jgi:hypothetical protein